MDAVGLGFSALATVSILVVSGLFSSVEQCHTARDSTRAILIAALGGSVVVLACLLRLLTLPALLVGPVVALAALFAILASSASGHESTPRRLAIAAASTTLVFLPVAAAVFGTSFDPFGTRLGVIDFGGAVPTLVGGGALAFGLSLIGAPSTGPARNHASAGRMLLLAILAWIACGGWMVGLELAADDMVPIIVASAVVTPAMAAVAATVVERLRSSRTTASGMVTGLYVGMAAAVPACAFVTAPLAAVIGLIVGAVGGVLPRVMRRSLAGPLAVGAAISTVLVGVFGTNIGYLYTGQPELVLSQLSITLVAAASGISLGAAIGWLFRRWPQISEVAP